MDSLRELEMQLDLIEDKDSSIATGAEAWIKRFVEENQMTHRFIQKLSVDGMTKLIILMNSWRQNEA